MKKTSSLIIVCMTFLIANSILAQTKKGAKIKASKTVVGEIDFIPLDSAIYTYNEQAQIIELKSMIFRNEKWENWYLGAYIYNSTGLEEERVDSRWNEDNWINSSRTLNEYDIQKNKTKETFQKPDNGIWLNTLRILYEYDKYNNLTLCELKEWSISNNTNGVWENVEREIHEFDEKGNPISLTYQCWEDSNWVNVFRTIYENEDFDNKTITRKLFQLWDGSKWHLRSLYETTYHENNSIIRELHERIKNGKKSSGRLKELDFATQTDFFKRYKKYFWEEDQWELTELITYQYDENQNEISKLEQNVTQIDTINTKKETFLYNDNKKEILKIIEEWENKWENKKQRITTYNDVDSLTEVKNQYWYKGDWITETSTTYKYNSLNLLIESEEFIRNPPVRSGINLDFLRHKKYYQTAPVSVGIEEVTFLPFSVYPNPSDGNFYIKIDEVDFLPININIYALSGKLVYSTTVKTKITRIAMPRLPSGIYLLQLQNRAYQRSEKISIIDKN